MELRLRSCHLGLRPTIIRPRHALAEVIRLHGPLGLREVVPRELPIDFIQVVGDQDDRRNYADAGRGLGDDVDLAEEEVVGGPDVRRVRGLVEGEFGAVGAVGDVLVGGEGPAGGKGGLGSEVGCEGGG